jgi:Glutaminase
MITIVPTLFDAALSDIDFPVATISEKHAKELFVFFKQHKLFNWKNTHNGCEGRADAVSILLEAWDIPNFKAWVFSGAFLKKHVGALKQNWKYHVATALPVKKDGVILHYILDPATADSLQLIEEWAANITLLPHSYYFTRHAHWYIFPNKNISKEKWNTRNKQNRKWMIQCLIGINGLTSSGKARLCFHKIKLQKTLLAFEQLKKEKPFLSFLNDA